MDIEGLSNGKTTESIPIWKKYTLTINEAGDYFGIGRNKLYDICKENPDAKFLLRNGTKYLIKRKLFEEYIDNLDSLDD